MNKSIIFAGLFNRFNVDDSGNAQLALFGASGVASLQLGGRTFVYAAGLSDEGPSVFELDAGGTLNFVESITNTQALALAGPREISFATVGGSTFAFVSGQNESGLNVFGVNPASGALTHVETVFDDAARELDGAYGATTVEVGGNSFLIASGYADDGLSVFQINANGTLTNISNLDGSAAIGAGALDGVNSIATAVIGAQTFVFAGSALADTVSVFQLGATGVLTPVGTTNDSVALELNGAFDVATATIGATTYLFVAGLNDSGVSVFSVDGAGALTNVFNLSDNASLGLDFARGVSSFELYGHTFLGVSGTGDDAISYFLVNADGSLSVVDTVSDGGALELDGTEQHSFALAGGIPFLITSGRLDSGLSVFEIGGGNDVLVGAAASDSIYGLGGDDILSGGGGNDMLYGGRGADAMNGGTGLEYARYDDADYGDLRISLQVPVLNTGVAAGDTFVEIEGLILTGNNDFGFGNEASNYIYGLGGDDYLDGRSGNDFLIGGTGNDTFHFMAGYGRDTVIDFNGGTGMGDRLDLQGTFASFAAVLAASTQAGANLEIVLNGTDVLVLSNFSISNLAQDDVIV